MSFAETQVSYVPQLFSLKALIEVMLIYFLIHYELYLEVMLIYFFLHYDLFLLHLLSNDNFHYLYISNFHCHVA